MMQGDRGTSYDFGPYEDEYRGFDLREDESGRGPLILILALGVLLIFAGVVWNTYRQGIRGGDSHLPVLKADRTTFKTAPEERGGLQAEGQQNAYYGSMDGLGDPAENREELSGSLPVLASATLSNGENSPVDENPSQAAPITFKQPQERASVSRPQTPVDSAPDTATQSSSGPTNLTRVDSVPPAEVAPTIQPSEPALLALNRFDQGGDYQVQLSALRSEEAARAAWRTIRGGQPDLYQGAPVQIQKADLGAKGVFYRLRVGTFAGRERAKSFCDDVKATGRDCMVVAKTS